MDDVADRQRPDADNTKRIALIDTARGLALLAMIIYHFTWDLEFFGYVGQGTTTTSGWRLFARSIASSFLFLAGLSLVLAHGNHMRWRSFVTRLAMIGGAALAITVATRIATPDRYIFFGILHCIAASSVIGLVFLKLPPLLTALAAAAVIFLAPMLATPFFDNSALLWLGLSTVPVRSNDYVPLVPWLGPFLLGMAVAQLAARRGLFDRIASMYRGEDPVSSGFMFVGRHSLLVYLIHQPILVAIVYLFSILAPVDPTVRFADDCNRTCRINNDSIFCVRFCHCALERLTELGLLEAMTTNSATGQSATEIQRVVRQCTADSFLAPSGE